jgi:hypothetical protein
MVDYWPSEEGAIVEGGLILNCYADAAISEGACVKWGTTGANKLPVATSAAMGDSCGVALKAATAAGDIIPVCFHGLVKMMLGETLAIGDAVVSAGSTGKVYGIEAASSPMLESVAGATMYILGYLFGGGNPGDEVPVLISTQ